MKNHLCLILFLFLSCQPDPPPPPCVVGSWRLQWVKQNDDIKYQYLPYVGDPDLVWTINENDTFSTSWYTNPDSIFHEDIPDSYELKTDTIIMAGKVFRIDTCGMDTMALRSDFVVWEFNKENIQ